MAMWAPRSTGRRLPWRGLPLYGLAMLPGLCAAAGAADPADASSLARGSLSGEQAADYATGLLLVFALLALLMWAARWMQSRNAFGRGGMRVLSSIGLGGKERLMVVDVDGERLLIGVAPGGVALIRALSEQEETASPATAQDQNWLTRTLSRGTGQ